jgi:hypothetical protein
MVSPTVLNSVHHCMEMRLPSGLQVGMLDLSVMHQPTTPTLSHPLVVVVV